MSTLRGIVALARVPPTRVAVAALLAALAIAFGAALMTTAGYLISRAAEAPPILSLTVAIVAVRFFGLARPVARYLERIASHDVALRSLARIRTRFYERLEPLAPAGLEAYRSGDLLGRMVGDVDALQDLYLRGLGPPIVAVLAGAACVGAAAAMLPAAAVILAAGLIAGGIAVPLIAAAIGGSAGRRQARARGELTAELVEVLRGAPELVAYGAGGNALDRVREGDDRLAALGRRDARASGIAEGLAVVIAGVTAAAVLAVAVAAHDAGGLDRVLVATLALLALSSFEAVAALPAAGRGLPATISSGKRVLELTEREPSISDPEGPLSPPHAAAPVALESVTARYTLDGPPALRDVDLRLEPGSRIALVGPSGAGKSTIAAMLLRFLDPEAGRVTIAGHDLREYRQADVRRMFAVAGQGAHLFNSTIRANLLIARPGATEGELEVALRQARIFDWVGSLPDGLETLIGEGGLQVSGGQRQRLTVARALLAAAPVLLLDEPAAHLDADTAARLMGDAFAAAGSRRVLLITHRSEGLDLVDEIVTLEGGRVVGRESRRPAGAGAASGPSG